MVLGIIFCLSALMCVAVTVLCAALIYEIWDYDFTSGAICFFFGCTGLSMLIFGVLLFIQGVAWIAGYH
nr:MAG TPA: hypothetical protein [Caudoviricetes sp.]